MYRLLGDNEYQILKDLIERRQSVATDRWTLLDILSGCRLVYKARYQPATEDRSQNAVVEIYDLMKDLLRTRKGHEWVSGESVSPFFYLAFDSTPIDRDDRRLAHELSLEAMMGEVLGKENVPRSTLFALIPPTSVERIYSALSILYVINTLRRSWQEPGFDKNMDGREQNASR